MTKRRVLLVDDVPEIRLFISMFIDRTDDFQVVAEADDGQAALDVADEAAPDVVLLDLNMPGRSGMDVLPELRQKLPRALIVIFSGFESVAIAEMTTQLGADAYVEKGTPAHDLLDQIRGLLADRPG